MAYTSVYDGVVFIEGSHPDARLIKYIKVDLGHKLGTQLKNINGVKMDIAAKVRNSGGNCVVGSTYGQKSKWLAIDDVAFWGSGKIALLPEAVYNEIISKKR